MKQVSFLLLSTLFIVAICSYTDKRFNPVGKWKGIHNMDGKVEYIEFLPDGRMRFIKENDSILAGEGIYRYKFDFHKDPVWFDIVQYSLAGDKIQIIEGIADVKSKDNFTVKLSKVSRPQYFEKGEGETIELSRLK